MFYPPNSGLVRRFSKKIEKKENFLVLFLSKKKNCSQKQNFSPVVLSQLSTELVIFRGSLSESLGTEIKLVFFFILTNGL